VTYACGSNFRTTKTVTILASLVFLSGIFAVSLNGQSVGDDPSDGMNLSVQFSSLPDGTSHVSN
jgi:hypothetical protein